MKENISLSGRLKIELYDKDGNLKDDRVVKNLVVNDGLDFITARMIGTSQAVMGWMGVGTSNTAASGAQTDLVAPLGARVALDSTTRTGASNQSVQYIATFSAGASTGAIVEAGIFNAGTSGDMLCRTVFNVINKGASDSLVLTWTVTLSAA